MSKGRIVSIHSFRGGTGKSNITVNLAACAARQGKRVAVLDTDLQSPGAHILFRLDPQDMRVTLVDYLWGNCTSEETAYDVTSRIGSKVSGKCWFVPASPDIETINRIIDEGYDVNRIYDHVGELITKFELDLLLIDTHPGLSKAMLLTTAISHALVLLVRPDEQDYYGTALLSEVAGRLEIPNIFLVVNKALLAFDRKQLEETIQKAFGHEVLALLPLCEELAALQSSKLFTSLYPEHEISKSLGSIVERLLRD